MSVLTTTQHRNLQQQSHVCVVAVAVLILELILCIDQTNAYADYLAAQQQQQQQQQYYNNYRRSIYPYYQQQEQQEQHQQQYWRRNNRGLYIGNELAKLYLVCHNCGHG